MKSRPMLKNIINETDPELFKKKKLESSYLGSTTYPKQNILKTNISYQQSLYFYIRAATCLTLQMLFCQVTIPLSHQEEKRNSFPLEPGMALRLVCKPQNVEMLLLEFCSFVRSHVASSSFQTLALGQLPLSNLSPSLHSA